MKSFFIAAISPAILDKLLYFWGFFLIFFLSDSFVELHPGNPGDVWWAGCGHIQLSHVVTQTDCVRRNILQSEMVEANSELVFPDCALQAKTDTGALRQFPVDKILVSKGLAACSRRYW